MDSYYLILTCLSLAALCFSRAEPSFARLYSKGAQDPSGQNPQEDEEDIQPVLTLHQISPAPAHGGETQFKNEGEGEQILKQHGQVLLRLSGFLRGDLRLPAHHKGIAENHQITHKLEGIAVDDHPNRREGVLHRSIIGSVLLFLRRLRNPVNKVVISLSIMLDAIPDTPLAAFE